jgi:phytanoyl-CoA hydroxylase
MPVSPDFVSEFRKNGYGIVRRFAPPEVCGRMLSVAQSHLVRALPPLEYEADVRYPGAPASHDVPGGRTVRRLLQAYARDPVFSEWASSRELGVHLGALLGPAVELSQAHHNCVMTKDPRYSSVTMWHRDIRYWSFERPELISVWLALGRERVRNGCLLVLPGSHEIEFGRDALDDAQFLRTDVESSRALLDTEVAVELDPGDMLLFHCRLFHAAGRNETHETKYSVVFTYHAADNRPLPGSRSASLPDVRL